MAVVQVSIHNNPVYTKESIERESTDSLEMTSEEQSLLDGFSPNSAKLSVGKPLNFICQLGINQESGDHRGVKSVELPVHTVAALRVGRIAKLPFNWITEHPWSMELLCEHSWLDKQYLIIRNNKTSSISDVTNFAWDIWTDDANFHTLDSVVVNLCRRFIKEQKCNKNTKIRNALYGECNEEQYVPMQLSHSELLELSETCSYLPLQKFFGDQCERHLNCDLVSRVQKPRRFVYSNISASDDSIYEFPEELIQVDVLRPFLPSKNTLHEVLESRYPDSGVLGVPSPLSPDTDFVDKCPKGNQQDIWKWEREKNPLGNVPPLCTCTRSGSLQTTYLTCNINENSNSNSLNSFANSENFTNIDNTTTNIDCDMVNAAVDRNIENSQKDHEINNITKKQKFPSYCSDKTCQGLLFVPYGFIEVSLHREIDNIITFCKKVHIPADTEVYFGRMRHTVIIVTKSIEHEYLCWKALVFANLHSSAQIYDADSSTFEPWCIPMSSVHNDESLSVLTSKNRSQTPHQVNDLYLNTPLHIDVAVDESDRATKNSDQKKSLFTNKMRIPSFGWTRRPLNLKLRDVSKENRSAAILYDRNHSVDRNKRRKLLHEVRQNYFINQIGQDETDIKKSMGCDEIDGKDNDDKLSPLSVTEEELIYITEKLPIIKYKMENQLNSLSDDDCYNSLDVTSVHCAISKDVQSLESNNFLNGKNRILSEYTSSVTDESNNLKSIRQTQYPCPSLSNNYNCSTQTTSIENCVPNQPYKTINDGNINRNRTRDLNIISTDRERTCIKREKKRTNDINFIHEERNSTGNNNVSVNKNRSTVIDANETRPSLRAINYEQCSTISSVLTATLSACASSVAPSSMTASLSSGASLCISASPPSSCISELGIVETEKNFLSSSAEQQTVIHLQSNSNDESDSHILQSFVHRIGSCFTLNSSQVATNSVVLSANNGFQVNNSENNNQSKSQVKHNCSTCYFCNEEGHSVYQGCTDKKSENTIFFRCPHHSKRSYHDVHLTSLLCKAVDAFFDRQISDLSTSIRKECNSMIMYFISLKEKVPEWAEGKEIKVQVHISDNNNVNNHSSNNFNSINGTNGSSSLKPTVIETSWIIHSLAKPYRKIGKTCNKEHSEITSYSKEIRKNTSGSNNDSRKENTNNGMCTSSRISSICSGNSNNGNKFFAMADNASNIPYINPSLMNYIDFNSHISSNNTVNATNTSYYLSCSMNQTTYSTEDIDNKNHNFASNSTMLQHQYAVANNNMYNMASNQFYKHSNKYSSSNSNITTMVYSGSNTIKNKNITNNSNTSNSINYNECNLYMQNNWNVQQVNPLGLFMDINVLEDKNSKNYCETGSIGTYRILEHM